MSNFIGREYLDSWRQRPPAQNSYDLTKYDACPIGRHDSVNATLDQNTEFNDLISLEAKVSVLKFELNERRKEMVQAQNVIAYLLKHNASAASCNTPCGTCQAGSNGDPYNKTHTLLMTIKAAFHALIVVLCKILASINSEYQNAKHKGYCTSLIEEDLLEFSLSNPDVGDTAPEPKAYSGRGTSAALVDQLVIPSSEGPEGQQSIDLGEQSVTVEEEDLSPKSLDINLLPYVTRFGDTSKGDDASAIKALNPASELLFHDDNTEVLQSSFTASSISSHDSTRYYTSGSTGLTSLNSSFHVSDDETQDLEPCSSIDEATEEKSTHRVPSVWNSISPPHAGDDTPAFERGDTIAITASRNIVLHQSQSTAALFIPRWPLESFGVSLGERERAIYAHKLSVGDQGHRFPDLFRYGIRFRPGPMETDLYRTVLMDNLPTDLRLSRLLEHVKGGAIASARLLNTTKINGGSSAIITFVHESGAIALERRASHRALEIDGFPARVTLLPTPTYPMSGILRAAITKHGHTRCLEIRNFPRGIKPADLELDLRVCKVMTTHRIEFKKMRSDGVLELRFTSIGYAGHAFGLFACIRRYEQCAVTFVPDPCSQPWDDDLDEMSTAARKAGFDGKMHEKAALNDVVPVSVTRWQEYADIQRQEYPSARFERLDSPTSKKLVRLADDGCHESHKTQHDQSFGVEEHSTKAKEPCTPQ